MSEYTKPCYHCGEDDGVVIGKHERGFVVECGECGAMSGVYPTREKAAEHWNTRPAEESLRKQLEDLLYFLRFVAEDVDCNSMPGLAHRIDEEIKKHEQKGER